MKQVAIFLPSRSPNVSGDLDLNGCGAREQNADWLAHIISTQGIGAEVHIFTNQEKPYHSGGIHYLEQDMVAPMLTSYEWDALITFDFPAVFSIPNLKDTVKRFIVVTNYYGVPPEGVADDEVLALVDDFVYPSEWAAKNCAELSGYDESKSVVIPYAADSRFHNGSVDDSERDYRFIYLNQPENGLAQLLRAWPEIYAGLHEPTLTIAVDVDEFVEQIQWSHSIQSELALDIKDLIDQPGVRYIGRQGRRELAEEMRTSDALLYPAEPLTPSDVGALSFIQAATHGCVPIFNPVDALDELYGEIGYACDESKSFAEHVLTLCNSDELAFLRTEAPLVIRELARDPASVGRDWTEFLSGVPVANS